MRMLAWIAFALAPINASAQDAPALSQRIAIYNPQWSPDGRTILFESNIDGAFGVYTIARDGTGLRRLTDPSFVAEQPTWSPDGASIVYSRRPNIHVMKADGSDDRPILSMPGGAYYQSSFSPDGRFIAFQGTLDPASTRDRVFVMRADGSDLRVLSDSAYGAEGPTWTSDGRITYQRVPYPKPYWPEMGPADMASARAETRLMSIRPDGSGLSEVPTPPEPARPAGVPAEASVTHDGRDFAFTRDSSGWSTLYAYESRSGRERAILEGRRSGPVGYLRAAAPVSVVDTFDTYLSPRDGGAIRPGNGAWFTRAVERIGRARWETTDLWHDSTGAETARQVHRTTNGSLATELESVRAAGDSASLLIHDMRATGWWCRWDKHRA